MPLSSGEESGFSNFPVGYSGDPWGIYQWSWNPMWAQQRCQSKCRLPLNPPDLGAGSSGNPVPVFIPLRGKRPRNAHFLSGKDPACLSGPIRKGMAKDDPLPYHPYLKCPQADDSIVD